MTYAIDVGALTPALAVTITDTVAIDTAGGVQLQVLDQAGNLLFTDAAPAVTVNSPTELVVTHTWQPGQTDTAGTYQVRVVTYSAGMAPSYYPGSGALTFYVGLAPLAGYCSIEQARDAGATGTDAEVLEAIAAGRRRIDRFTGDTFAPTRMVVVGVARNDGTVLMPRVVRSVEYVRPVGGGKLAPGSWRALSSLTPGQVDAVILGGPGYADPLIVGAEPWRGGWRGFVGNLLTGQLEVGGIFGWDEPPPEVVTANAYLAAQVTSGSLPGGGTLGPDTDDEGNVVKVTVSTGAPTPQQRTTGSADADGQLAGLVRRYVRFGV